MKVEYEVGLSVEWSDKEIKKIREIQRRPDKTEYGDGQEKWHHQKEEPAIPYLARYLGIAENELLRYLKRKWQRY